MNMFFVLFLKKKNPLQLYMYTITHIYSGINGVARAFP